MRRLLAGLLGAGVECGKEGDFVHDVRVAARRLGEVARLLEKFMDKPSARAVDGSLKSLRRSMGELRDSDVTREHLSKWRMPHAVKGWRRGWRRIWRKAGREAFGQSGGGTDDIGQCAGGDGGAGAGD